MSASKDDNRRPQQSSLLRRSLVPAAALSIIVILVTSIGYGPHLIGVDNTNNFSAYASDVRVNDEKGETSLVQQYKDLDIAAYGFANKNAYIEVVGAAGGTIGEDISSPPNDGDGHGIAIAYVIEIKTTTGELQTWAIDSHEAEHSETGIGVEWHAHRVHVGDNPNTPDTEPGNCVNEVDEVLHAKMDGSKVIFEDMRVKGKNGEWVTVVADEFKSALTVLLDVEVADPDDPPSDAPCIALVDTVFDTAK